MGNIDYKIIVRYLNGTCNEEEKLHVIRWANESEEHARQLFEWEELYFLGKRSSGTEQFKTQEAEERLFNRIRQEQLRQEENRGRKVFRLRTWTKYAAAVTLLITSCGLGMWYFTHNLQQEWKTLATADGEVKEFLLPDSSWVWLNENSVLQYPEQFEKGHRQLKLSGEAYFEVTKDKHRPFIVSSKDMNVAVLGTKFNFRSTQTDRIVEVSLLEGEVKASGTHEEGAITLSPGQKVELNKDTGKMKVMDTNAMLDAVWHSSMVKLQNASITQIAQLLEEVYDVKVILSPGVEKTSTYSGELKKKGTATDMLDALKHTLHIKYRKHKDIVFISPE